MKKSTHSFKLLYVFAFLIALIFTECRKGPDDPRISLRSRKARLCGAWNLKSGHIRLRVSEKGYPPTDLDIQHMNGSTADVQDDYSYALYSINYSLRLEIKTDGTFTMNENYSGSAFSSRGTWDFSGGGRLKNKEAVVFVITSVDNGSTGSHLFNKECTEFTYELTELRNKEIAMDKANDIYINSNGDEVSFSGHFIFQP
jgi:hypothetical protein